MISIRPPLVMVMGLVVLGAIAAPAMAQQEDKPEFLLIVRSMQVMPVRLVSINDQFLEYFDEAKGFPRIALSECIALVNAEAKARPRSAGMLILADGQQLPGSPIARPSDDPSAFAWNHTWLGRMDVPLDLIQTVLLSRDARVPTPGNSDVIRLINGDRQEGFVIALGERVTLELTHVGAGRRPEIEIPLDRVESIAMVTPRKPQTGRRIWFDEGTVLDVDGIVVGVDGYVRFTGSSLASGTQPTNVGLGQIAAVLLDSDAMVPLAALSPTMIEGPETRYILPKPEVIDRDAPLGLSRVEYKGPLVARYVLPQGCARFVAEAELPRASRLWGDYELILHIDDEEVFRQRFSSESPAAKINVPVTGRELTVELAPGARGPIQDRLILSRAMLLTRAR